MIALPVSLAPLVALNAVLPLLFAALELALHIARGRRP